MEAVYGGLRYVLLVIELDIVKCLQDTNAKHLTISHTSRNGLVQYVAVAINTFVVYVAVVQAPVIRP
jgi:hypothetical protein